MEVSCLQGSGDFTGTAVELWIGEPVIAPEASGRLADIRVVGAAAESQAQSLVGADSAFSNGLSLRDFADRKSEVPGVF